MVAGRGRVDSCLPFMSSNSSGGRLIVAMLRDIGARRLRCRVSLARRLMRCASSSPSTPASPNPVRWRSPRLSLLRRRQRWSALSSAAATMFVTVSRRFRRCPSSSPSGGSSSVSGCVLSHRHGGSLPRPCQQNTAHARWLRGTTPIISDQIYI